MGKSTHTPLYERLKVRLVSLREQANLTQRDVAQRVGWQQSIICRIETGERRIDVTELFSYCLAIGADPKAVFESLAADFAEVNASLVRAERRKKLKRKTTKPRS